MVALVCEQGFARASVTAVCARAGVSRSAFYELFEGREGCFLAVIDEGYSQVSSLIAAAFDRAEQWREGLQLALADLLALFDSEPELAQVWLVESLAAGSWALERRAGHIEALTREIVDHWRPPPSAGSHPLAAVGVMESLLGIVQTRALRAPGEPMIVLLGELIGIAVAPYLDDQAVAGEVALATARARELVAAPGRPRVELPDPVPDAILDPRAHRARACVRYLAQHPGASNRQIARAVGIKSHTQMSALLSRLTRAGLLQKRPGRPGHANSWSLTSYAQRALDTRPSHTSQTLLDFTVTS